MIVKELLYNENDNITKLVKCLEKDRHILENIPHQPGEFSSKKFKKTYKCDVNKNGDYYDYYKNCKQLATTKHNINTTFKSIQIKKHSNCILKINKVKLTIHKQYSIENIKTKSKLKGACLIFVSGIFKWGVFIQDCLPYLYFLKDILDNDKNINIYIVKEKNLFDSFNFIFKTLLKITNKIVYLNHDSKVEFKNLYELKLNGPFASGLFPYIGHCTCPVILYKNLRKNILDNYLNQIEIKKPYLIYTSRNTGNKMRKLQNENIIIELLKKFCIEKNIEFINFFYKNYDIDNRFKLFYQAKYVVGVHGSANFHTLFCNNDVKIIEFICIKDCHSTQLVNMSYGLEYWQIPIKEYGQYEKTINITEESLQSLKEILNVI